MAIGVVLALVVVLTGCASKDKDSSAKSTDHSQEASQSAADSNIKPVASKGNLPDANSNASSPSATSASLVGKWEGQTEIYGFFPDGTGAITFKPHVPKDDVGKITWSGSTVQIGKITGNATFSADGKTLTLTDPKTGYASKFKKI